MSIVKKIGLMSLEIKKLKTENKKLNRIISQKIEAHDAWSDQQSLIIKRLVIENKQLKNK